MRVISSALYKHGRTLSTAAATVASENARINALVHLKAQERVHQAGPLQGVTVAVKDNICTRDLPTTCSSKMLADFRPPYDATVVELLCKSGAEIIGKANCDEFGMGSLNIHSSHGPVINPFQATKHGKSVKHSQDRSTGGSSGGSAAAVAAGLCEVALGTDTGGSVRLPASYCGVVGLKPSYGLLSRWGVVSFADSLDCVGIFSKETSSTKRAFDTLNVFDPKDPTAAASDVRAQALSLSEESWSGNLQDLRVGIPQDYFPSELSPSVVTPLSGVLDRLKALGVTIVPVSLPSTSYALSAYYVISSAEASSNMARYDGVQYGLNVRPDKKNPSTAANYAETRTVGFGAEVKKRILLGTYALTADAFDNYFLQAQRVRQLIQRDFNNTFLVPNVTQNSSTLAASSFTTSPTASIKGVHVLMHPSSIRTAPHLPSSSRTSSKSSSQARKKEAEDLSSYVQDVLTVPASLGGLPAISVPIGLAEPSEDDDGWPVGMSIVGQWGCDGMVLDVAKAVEGVARGS